MEYDEVRLSLMQWSSTALSSNAANRNEFNRLGDTGNQAGSRIWSPRGYLLADESCVNKQLDRKMKMQDSWQQL